MYERIPIKKKKIIVDFAVQLTTEWILKEDEKKVKYLDLARELKKKWNKKVTVILIVIAALV